MTTAEQYIESICPPNRRVVRRHKKALQRYAQAYHEYLSNGSNAAPPSDDGLIFAAAVMIRRKLDDLA
jgi:hypothetical protein